MTPVSIEELHDSDPMSVADLISIFKAEVLIPDRTPPGYRIRWVDDIPWLEPKRGPLNFVRRWRWERKELAA
jgi:hypothetical protein